MVDRTQDIQPLGDMPIGFEQEHEASRSVFDKIRSRREAKEDAPEPKAEPKEEKVEKPADTKGVEEKSTPVVESKSEATGDEQAPTAEDTDDPAPSKEDTAADDPQEAQSGTPESYIDGKYKSKAEFETAHRHLTAKLTQETQRRAESEKRLAALEAEMLEQTRFDGLPADVQDKWHDLADQRGRGENGQDLFYRHLDSQLADRQAKATATQAHRNAATERVITWLETDERAKKHNDLLTKTINESPALMSALRGMDPEHVEPFARQYLESQMELQELRNAAKTKDAEFQAREKLIRDSEREKLRANRELKRTGTEASRGNSIRMGDDGKARSTKERILARAADRDAAMT